MKSKWIEVSLGVGFLVWLAVIARVHAEDRQPQWRALHCQNMECVVKTLNILLPEVQASSAKVIPAVTNSPTYSVVHTEYDILYLAR